MVFEDGRQRRDFVHAQDVARAFRPALEAPAAVGEVSHWLHGGRAGGVRGLDAAHSLVGPATHHASALFWAVPRALWLRRAPDRSAGAASASPSSGWRGGLAGGAWLARALR